MRLAELTPRSYTLRVDAAHDKLGLVQCGACALGEAVLVAQIDEDLLVACEIRRFEDRRRIGLAHFRRV